jgi:hypothetical protein
LGANWSGEAVESRWPRWATRLLDRDGRIGDLLPDLADLAEEGLPISEGSPVRLGGGQALGEFVDLNGQLTDPLIGDDEGGVGPLAGG